MPTSFLTTPKPIHVTNYCSFLTTLKPSNCTVKFNVRIAPVPGKRIEHIGVKIELLGQIGNKGLLLVHQVSVCGECICFAEHQICGVLAYSCLLTRPSLVHKLASHPKNCYI